MKSLRKGCLHKLVLDSTGSKSYPIVNTYNNQTIYEFRDRRVFVLEDHVYRKAGSFHWRPKYEKGELKRQGISLNKRVFAAAMKEDGKDFLVYDVKRRRVFRFNDRSKIVEAREASKKMYRQGDKESGSLKETRNGRELVVLPLDAFTRDDLSRIPEGLRKKFR